MVLFSLTLFMGQGLYQQSKDKFLPVTELFNVEKNTCELKYVASIFVVVFQCIQFCAEFGPWIWKRDKLRFLIQMYTY